MGKYIDIKDIIWNFEIIWILFKCDTILFDFKMGNISLR